MRTLILTCLLCMQLNSLAQEQYPIPEDSKVHEGVPRGKVEGPFEFQSKIYPGTIREYWLYVPEQYDARKAACVFVVQDGLNRAKGWRLPTVMDNLIHKNEMPVTIGIFVSPGVVPAPHENSQPRFNRSFEYDAMGDRYARFLLDELLPKVSETYNLSSNPNDRSIAGASSGGICAFTVAWERPNEFRRVLSTIGTFVGLRGGNEYPTLVRKHESKPIRVFLQDGSSDLNIYGGDWWVANQDMLSALKFSGYDVRHAWGTGGHNGKHAAAIMPDALRWLWRDYPAPIKPGNGAKRRTDILLPDEDWKLVSEGHQFTEGPAVNSKGEVFFTDVPRHSIYKIGLDGTVSVFTDKCKNVSGLMFGDDGNLYACQIGTSRIVRFDAAANEEVILEDAPCNDLVVLPNGGFYTDHKNKRVFYVDKDGHKKLVDQGIEFPNGIMVTADQTQLIVANSRGRFLYSFSIQDDGTLANKQPYGYLHIPDDGSDSGADGMTVDQTGRLYVATKMGVQVLDQLGRVHLIIRRPHTGFMSNVVFGGKDLDELYLTCGDKVFKRKLHARGVIPWKGPHKPPRPGL